MIGWLKLASHLHLPLQVVMRQTTSSEFIIWMEYLDNEERRNQKSEYYWAQIAAEVRRSIEAQREHPHPVKNSDFLITYKDEEKKPNQKVDKALKTEASKKFWFTVTGYKRKGKR